MGIASGLHRIVNGLIFRKLKYIQILVHLIFKKCTMSIQLLRDKVYEKCELKLVGFDKIEGTPITQIHNSIRKEFELRLREIINSFVAELSKHPLPEKKKEIALNFKELFCSKEFKGIFKHDINYSEEYKMKCIKECEINDPRTSKKFVLEKNYDLSDKSKDFYCVFIAKRGWNSWVEEFSPAKYIISVEHNNTDNSIVQRYEIRDLPKILNSVPVVEIENYIPRISILEEIFNLFEQKKKKINITGISGIGKTFLAKHFVQHYSEKFSHIVWLDCSSGIRKAFTEGKGVELLDIMGLTSEHNSYLERNISDEILMRKVLGRIKNFKGNNILILDNADEEISFYLDEIRLSDDWKVLVTSQKSLEGFCNYIIPSFEEKSLNLFYKYYTLEIDDDNLIRLLSAIEYHTLTIELLAKTAQQRKLTIIELVNRFIENGINVVEKAKITADHNLERNTKIENIEEYLNIVFNTSVLSEEECKILLNIAILQSELIDIILFKEVYLNNSSENKVIDVFEHNISILSSTGWIQIDSNTIRIHNLVQTIIIKKFIHKNDFFDSTIKYLRRVSTIGHTQNYLQKSKYLKLSESILEKINVENNDTINLKNIIAVFYTSIGLYEKANKYEINYLNQLKETQQIVGNVSDKMIDILARLNNLSSSFVSQGKFEDALTYASKLYNYFDEAVIQELYWYLTKSMVSFFKKNKIDNASQFEGDFNLTGHVKVVNMIMISMSYIVMFQDKKKNHSTLTKIVVGLEKIFLSRQKILDIFEENISEPLIFSIRAYKDLLLSNNTISIYIGQYYMELKKYDKAEEAFKSALIIQEKILDPSHFDFSHNYHSLTCLYIKCGNIEQARFFLEKNKTICSTFPSNHPCVILLKSDIKGFEKLENDKFFSENIEKIIQSRFEVLYQKNQDSTKLTDYYEILYSIYFRYDNYKKACEYVTKEIDAINNNGNIPIEKLFALYLKSSECHLLLVDFNKAWELFNKAWELFNKALILYNEEELKCESIDSQIKKHKEKIITCGVKFNDVPTISDLITRKLDLLKDKYFNFFSSSFPKTDALNIAYKVFVFLYNLPDLKQTIKDTGSNEEQMSLFLKEYDVFFDNLIKEFAEVDYAEIHKSKVGYKILDEYYQALINLFLKYENWDLAYKYSFRKLLINEKHFDQSITIGLIHYTISYCYFKLQQFELAAEEITKAISNYNKALVNINQKETYKKTKVFLKETLDLEKLIKEELEKFIKQ